MLVNREFLSNLNIDYRIVNCYPEEYGDFFILYSDGSIFLNSRSEEIEKIRSFSENTNRLFDFFDNSNKDTMKNIKNLYNMMEIYKGYEFDVCRFLSNGESYIERITLDEFDPKKSDIYIYNKNEICFVLVKANDKNIDELIKCGDLKKAAMKYIGGSNLMDDVGIKTRLVNMSDEPLYLVINGCVEKLNKLSDDKKRDLLKNQRINEEYYRRDKSGHYLIISFSQNNNDDYNIGSRSNVFTSFLWFNDIDVRDDSPLNPDDSHNGDIMIFKYRESANEYNRNGGYREHILNSKRVRKEEKRKKFEDRKDRLMDVFESELGKIITAGAITTGVSALIAAIVKIVKKIIDQKKSGTVSKLLIDKLIKRTVVLFGYSKPVSMGAVFLRSFTSSFSFLSSVYLISKILNKILKGVGNFIKEIPIVKKMIAYVKYKYNELITSDTKFGKIVNFLDKCVRSTVSFVKMIINSVKGFFKMIGNSILNGIRRFFGKISDFLESKFSFCY